jgi:membrane protein YdbS with pleckstrin-like domain
MRQKFWYRFLGFDPNRERTFPGQQPDEEVMLMTVAHSMRLMRFIMYWMIFLLTLIALNTVVTFFTELPIELRFQINTLVVAGLIHLLFFRLYNHSLKVILITNHRLIDIRHSVFLQREREAIPLINIQDIQFRQNGILPRIFGYGDLIVFGSSNDVCYRFHYVPRVDKIHHILCEMHQNVMRRHIQMRPAIDPMYETKVVVQTKKEQQFVPAPGDLRL